ncbi:MAG: hypothetical protein GYB65_04555 [Chloroflexi bacterium]|nr:hypothetical protein [Chloroflexota bacterium]
MYFPSDEPIRRGRESFPRKVPALHDLPKPVQRAIQQHHSPDDIRTLLDIPPQRYPLRHTIWRYEFNLGWRRTPPRLLVFGANAITLVEGTDAHTTYFIPLDGLLSIRLVTVLLYSTVQFEWRDSARSGALVHRLQIQLNTIGLRMVEPELDQARTWIAAHSGVQDTPVETEPPAAASVRDFPLKFTNFTRSSLLSEEAVWVGVYEPAIREAGRWGRPIAPNRAIVLTGQHLIVVSDRENAQSTSSTDSYLIDRWFCPRAQITQAIFDKQNGVTWLTLWLGDATCQHRLPLLEPRADLLQSALNRWLVNQAAQVAHS